MTHEEAARELVKAIKDQGKHAAYQPFDRSEGHVVHYVNVWQQPHDRYPAQSVVVDDDGFTWGPNFEFNQPPTERAFATVAKAVLATLPTDD